MTEVDSNKQKKAYIFIDEYRTPALNIESSGVKPYFIYVAVLIESENLEKPKNHYDLYEINITKVLPLKRAKFPMMIKAIPKE